MSGADLMHAFKAWYQRAQPRFVEFFARRALVTRAQISLALLKRAEEEAAPEQKPQNSKD